MKFVNFNEYNDNTIDLRYFLKKPYRVIYLFYFCKYIKVK